MNTLWYGSQDFSWVLWVGLSCLIVSSGAILGHAVIAVIADWRTQRTVRQRLREIAADRHTADPGGVIHRAFYPQGHPQAAGLKSDRKSVIRAFGDRRPS